MTASGRAPIALALLVALGLVAGACAPAAGPLGMPATPRATTVTSADPGASDEVPATASPTVGPSASPTLAPSGSGEAASTGPSSGPPATAEPTDTPGPGATTAVRAYFLTSSDTGSVVVVPVLREVPATKAVGAAAMTALLAGPNDIELAASPPITTRIPKGTRVLALSIADGVATVNLSREFKTTRAMFQSGGATAQIVFTLTQFPTVKLVRLDVEDEAFIGPTGRSDWREIQPLIFLDRPAWGAAAGNPARIAGLANVFEATFRAQILDGKGTVIADQQVMASCGTGCWGTFKAGVPYAVDTAQYGTLRVFNLSARDGSVENLSEYRVWLTPAG